ncbi:hypothetical protein NE865_14035 [Phthorimaea operculella]|nr:hypothetical protein NE865_14035 [Phthorimaea operculella]
MAPKDFEQLTDTQKYNWSCPSCICATRIHTPNRSSMELQTKSTLDGTFTRCVNMTRGTNQRQTPILDDSSVHHDSSNPDLHKQFADLREYIDKKLDSMKTEILSEITVRIKTIEDSMQQIQAQNNSHAERLDELDGKITSITSDRNKDSVVINDLARDIPMLKEDIDQLKNENLALKSKLSDLENLQNTLNDVEQRARLHNLEIFGIPEKNTENLVNIVSKIGAALNVTVKSEDLEYVTRIQSRSKNAGLPKTVIVKFKSLILRDNFLSAARKKRGLTSSDIQIPGEAKNVFINEHLTAKNKALLKKVRAVCKDLGFQSVWTRNAKIYIRKHPKVPAIRIYDEDQVTKLSLKK